MSARLSRMRIKIEPEGRRRGPWPRCRSPDSLRARRVPMTGCTRCVRRRRRRMPHAMCKDPPQQLDVERLNTYRLNAHANNLPVPTNCQFQRRLTGFGRSFSDPPVWLPFACHANIKLTKKSLWRQTLAEIVIRAAFDANAAASPREGESVSRVLNTSFLFLLLLSRPDTHPRPRPRTSMFVHPCNDAPPQISAHSAVLDRRTVNLAAKR